MPTDPKKILDRITIAVPCSESWDQMTGNESVRSCGACKKNVYDLTNLRLDEIAVLFAGTEPPCVRFYRRPDGRIATGDCRLTWENVKRKTAKALVSAAGARSPEAIFGRALRLALLPLIVIGVVAGLFGQNVAFWWSEVAGSHQTELGGPEASSSARRVQYKPARMKMMGGSVGTQ